MDKPSVFISSTINKMEKTRALIKDLFENQLGYRILMSEHEGSKSKTPIAQCKKWAKECDIFVAILGKDYGWIVPELGISVSELEFNEALKDNPEKILVYISSCEKDDRQKAFTNRLTDFSKGYYRRAPYGNDNEIISGIREDLADFFKDRLNLIRKKGLKIRQNITPAIEDYTSFSMDDRREKMLSDIVELATNTRFKHILTLKPSHAIFTRNIGRTLIAFTMCIWPDNFSSSGRHGVFRDYDEVISYNETIGKYPNRFTITFVLGNARLSTLESRTRYSGGICAKVEPGLFRGEALSPRKGKSGQYYYQNELIVSNITNKNEMTRKLVECVDWLQKESYRINFRCNYRKPPKTTIIKYKPVLKRL